MKTQPVYVEVRIQAPLETVWERAHQPRQHARWDLRFSDLEYLPRVGEEEPQRFRFTTRIGLGLRIRGEGVFLGTKDARHGSRTTALRFWCPDRRALVRSGYGCWRFIPDEGATTFVTRYDYETRYGLAGAIVDRFFFRPLLGWATAWSFDRLRLWLEHGVTPELSLWKLLPRPSRCRRTPLQPHRRHNNQDADVQGLTTIELSCRGDGTPRNSSVLRRVRRRRGEIARRPPSLASRRPAASAGGVRGRAGGAS